MSKETLVYSFSEDDYIRYMNKLYSEKLAVNNLLFDEPYISDNMHVRALLCEQYASCYYLENILDEVMDLFNEEKQEFYLTEIQATKFIILLSSLSRIKEELLKNVVSLSFH